MTVASVRLWGNEIGAISLAGDGGVASFEYDPDFAAAGIELSPLRMPATRGRIYRFPELAKTSFHGLPGLVADSLPDRFGNALIDAWLATHGRAPGSFDPIERLCYIGRRGMGALEFEPSRGPDPAVDDELDVAALVELSGEVLAQRADLSESLAAPAKHRAMQEILRVGTAAGGARPKALIAWNPETEEVRSGQVDLPSGFEFWILKFDGVDDASRDLGHSKGYGAIEWAYSEMAREAGIEMTECRLLEEDGRRHFMTRRFDRSADGDKLHMQSLAALDHLDFELGEAHSYEQAFGVIRRLGLSAEVAEEQFRRMVFNVVGRNQDDHVKNISFLMDRRGEWSLSPAFDVVYSFNPEGRWTRVHQMSINGKRDGFTVADLDQVASVAGLQRGAARRILGEVIAVVERWPEFASDAGIEDETIRSVRSAQRLRFPRD
ncbi:MAG TPA: type II toxin-antitoxin system HipA family toxin [Solirubrobacterales bacterium]|jgi:serine/threonine-protein kinase HipA|nr:type II toxin-antitoxin system HipA family toxin [Solirubrobacterales bacterium]